MKPQVKYCDDGSTLIEWRNRDMCFYIALGKDKAESSWGLVDKSNADVGGEFGELPKEILDLFKPSLFKR